MKKIRKVCILSAAVFMFSVPVCVNKGQTVNGGPAPPSSGAERKFRNTELKAGAVLSDLLYRKPEVYIEEEDTEILLKIAESEAGTEGIYGKALVMNVVLNRVGSPEFPDTVSEVVFQNSGGRYQFCPVRNGSYYTAEVSEESLIALDMVLCGWDKSQGATYFCRPQAAGKWHEKNLKFLFQYKNHRFYKEKEGSERK